MTEVLLIVTFVAWLAVMALLVAWIVNTYIDGPFDRWSKRTWYGRIKRGMR